MERKRGDWKCACGFNNWASNDKCKDCYKQKPGAGVGPKPGDWSCTSCCTVNFASRNACYNCAAHKPHTMPPSTYNPPSPNFGGFPASAPATVGGKPGDWMCSACNTNNFASRNACFRCQALKPLSQVGGSVPVMSGHVQVDGGQPPSQPPPMYNPPSNYNPPSIYNPPSPNFGGVPASAPAAMGGKPGDWVCSACNTNNFASRNACFKCQAIKPSSQVGGSVPVMSGPVQVDGGKPGDWVCTMCNTNNFASRNACFRCQALKPSPQPVGIISGPVFPAVTTTVQPYGFDVGIVDGMPQYPPPRQVDPNSKFGDWVCPVCTTNNFGSRAACFKCQAPKSQAPSASQKPGTSSGSCDWNCPNCHSWNFSRRTSCFKCSKNK